MDRTLLEISRKISNVNSPCLLRGTAPVRLIVIGKIMNKDFRSMTLNCVTNYFTILRLDALNNSDRLKTWSTIARRRSQHKQERKISRINIHVKISFASRSLRDIVSPFRVRPGIANEETFYLRKFRKRFRTLWWVDKYWFNLSSGDLFQKITWFVCLCGFLTWFGVGEYRFTACERSIQQHTCCNEKYKQTLKNKRK